jgi:hypothetical protein
VDTLELFPDLVPSVPANGDGCTKPIGRRTRARRRGSVPGPRRSPIAGQLLELRRLVEAQHEAVMDELAALRQQRRNDGEIPAALLRRVVEIERHLRLVESPAPPRLTRRRPLDG